MLKSILRIPKLKLPVVSTEQTGRMPFYPLLDSLRAVAVLAVILHHYNEAYFGNKQYGYLALAGVNIFFVLSGFLITNILLRSRNEFELHGKSRLKILSRFFVHRVFRIFPLYYLVIILALLFRIPSASANSASLLTYTINYAFIGAGKFIEPFSHFWTLAVEFQFYLLWPFVVLLVPRP